MRRSTSAIKPIRKASRVRHVSDGHEGGERDPSRTSVSRVNLNVRYLNAPC